MAVDATGTPTSLGIPKFNTAVDAPSGKGGNAQMDSIDTLLIARVAKPSGIITGETIVYNGSTFDRSSVTKLVVSSLAITGTPNGTKFLRDDASWQAVVSGPTITRALTPPGSPADGDIWYYVDSLTATTVQWAFRWNNGSSNTDKWEFIGGSPLYANIDTNETLTTPTVYSDAPTPGPSVTVPRGGVYEVWMSADFASTQGNTDGFASIKRGAATATDADSMIDHTGSAIFATHARMIVMTGLAASTVLKMQYKTGSLNLVCQKRWLQVRPIRVS